MEIGEKFEIWKKVGNSEKFGKNLETGKKFGNLDESWKFRKNLKFEKIFEIWVGKNLKFENIWKFWGKIEKLEKILKFWKKNLLFEKYLEIWKKKWEIVWNLERNRKFVNRKKWMFGKSLDA